MEILNGVKNNGRCLTTVRRSLALVYLFKVELALKNGLSQDFVSRSALLRTDFLYFNEKENRR